VTISKSKAAIFNLAFNYANIGFTIITGLILVPLYLKFFDLNLYGSWLSSGNIVGLLGLLDAGINLVFAQRLALSFGAKDFKLFSQFAGSGLLLSLALSFLIAFTGIIISVFVPAWVNAELKDYESIKYAFMLASLGAGFSLANFSFASIVQAWLETKYLGIISFISLILGTAATIIGLYLNLGILALPLGILVKSFLSCVMLIIFIRIKWQKFDLPKMATSRKTIKDLAITTSPVMVARIGGNIMQNSQLIIVANFINPAASALLVITSKVFDVGRLILGPIGSSVFAGLAIIEGGNDMNHKRNIVYRLLIIFTALSVVLFSSAYLFNKPFISIWVGPELFGGNMLSLLLMLVAFLSTRMSFINLMLTSFGIIGKTAWSGQIELAIRLLLIFLLIKHLGIIALPLAELLSILMVSAWYLNVLLKNKLELEMPQAVKIIFSGAIGAMICIGLSIILQFIFQNPLPLITTIFSAFLFLMLSSTIVFFTGGNSKIFIAELNKIGILNFKK